MLKLLDVLEQLIGGTMNAQEKARHAKKLKKLKSKTKKQGDEYMVYPNLPKTVIGVKIEPSKHKL